jgi:glycine amidinotransferase
MSNWISINTLMLDEERIVVEARQENLIRALKQWGFQPIPCAFEDYYPFIGGFHCATLDVRRCGELQSYD